MGEERRKSVRIKAQLVIQYCLECDGSMRWDITSVRDISETGLCILTGRQYDPEETITLRLKIPSRPFEKIEVAGRVVGSSSAGKGTSFITRIEFKDLAEETRALFHEYLGWLIKSSNE